MGKPITLYDQSTPAAKITAQLAGEIPNRMNSTQEENDADRRAA